MPLLKDKVNECSAGVLRRVSVDGLSTVPRVAQHQGSTAAWAWTSDSATLCLQLEESQERLRSAKIKSGPYADFHERLHFGCLWQAGWSACVSAKIKGNRRYGPQNPKKFLACRRKSQ